MIEEIRFEIGCKNLTEQVEFYSNILGGQIVSNEEGFVVMRIAGIKFALWDATDNKNAQKIGITMVTKNPNSVKEKLRENRSLVSEWEGCTMFVTADPDGNGITFMEGNSD